MFVKRQGAQEELDLSKSKSAYTSQSMATTENSSVASADGESRITSVKSAPTPQKSALKREYAPSRLHQNVRIRFNPAVQQQRHFPLHEYTTEELNACWFRGEEYTKITQSCCKVLKVLEQQQQESCRGPGDASKHTKRGHADRKQYCFRGLESHTRLATISKNQNRRLAWDAVLDGLFDQSSLGVFDDEAIACRYRDASSSCKLWAIRVAQQDQRVAECLYDTILV